LSPTVAEDYLPSAFENMMLRKMEEAIGKLRKERNWSFMICPPHPM